MSGHEIAAKRDNCRICIVAAIVLIFLTYGYTQHQDERDDANLRAQVAANYKGTK